MKNKIINSSTIPFNFAVFDSAEMSRSSSTGAAFRADQVVSVNALTENQTVVTLACGEFVNLNMTIDKVLMRIEVAEDKTYEKIKAINL